MLHVFKKPKLIISGLFIAIIVGVIAYIQANPKLEKLTIADANQAVFALVYIAEERGYFRDEGLDIAYREFALGKDAIEDVVQGNADMALVYDSPFVTKLFEGQDIAAISSLHYSSKNTAIIARKDRGIYAAGNLWNKKIGVHKGTNAEYFLDVFLASEGILKEGVTIVDMSGPDLEKAFIDGSVDAVAIWSVPERLQNPAVQDLATVFYSDIYTEVSLLAGMRSYITSRPEVMDKLTRALVRAEDYYNSHRAESAEIIARSLGHESSQSTRSILDAVTVRVRLDNVLLTILNQEGDWYIKQGTYAPPMPDFRRALIDGYLYDAKPTAVTVN